MKLCILDLFNGVTDVTWSLQGKCLLITLTKLGYLVWWTSSMMSRYLWPLVTTGKSENASSEFLPKIDATHPS